VVGTSPTHDIAVLQLTGASGLTTANFGDSSSVKVGASVTGVGNAGGTGGTPSAARGTVTALHRTITASGDSAASEKLTDMIVVNAPIVSGDSGGPLYDADNKVVGIDTAAATSVGISRGYAIPIDRALAIASRIESGKASATIHIGYPAFLGVGLSSGSGRPTIAQVFSGSPAAKAGLAAGDVVTAVDGHPVSDYAKLHHLLITRSPGETVNITYTDTSGASRTVKVTLTTGPAD
jgi:S1-C subfamily serine protease